MRRPTIALSLGLIVIAARAPVRAAGPAALPELDSMAEVVPPGAVADESIRLVQAGGVRAADLRDRLEAAGFDVLAFVPGDAYLVRVTASSLPALRAIPGVRTEGACRAAMKVDARLADAVVADDSEGAAPVRVRAAFHRGADLDLHAGLLAAVPGARVLSSSRDGLAPAALLQVAPGSLRRAVDALAAMRDVARVELAPLPAPTLDDAVWYLQTGHDTLRATDYGQTASLFRRGITGRGVLVGLIDDGLENDSCQFRYTTTVDDTAWELGPSADAAVPVPDEGGSIADGPVVRTRERHVVAYYQQAGAAPYSCATQHGTLMAEAILGDNPAVLAARPLVRDAGDAQNVRPFRPDGAWTIGQSLRDDIAARVDDPSMDSPSFPNTYGSLVEHHQSGDGMAPGAQLVFLDIGDAAGALSGTPSTLQMLRQARRTGATVATVAYGLEGCVDCYDTDAADADEAAWSMRDLALIVSAGNTGELGPQSINGGIAQCKSASVVGATTRANALSTGTPRLGEDVARFSSLGPSTGGRIAPEVMAPGLTASHNDPGMAVNPEDGSGIAPGGCGMAAMAYHSGTSFSTAVLAGGAALIQQYFLDGYYPSGMQTAADAMRPTNALVRAVLVNSARDLGGALTDGSHAGTAHRPSMGQGWGAPRLDDTLYFAGDPRRGSGHDSERARFVVLNDVANGVDFGARLTAEPGGRTRRNMLAGYRPAITDGAIHEWTLSVANPDPADVANELRITLAWSDAPGASATQPLVNDLDLEVVSPGPDGIMQSGGGTLRADDVAYRPRPDVAWSLGFSVPSATPAIAPAGDPASVDFPDRDGLNTLENVFVRASDVVAGTWLVRVIGRSVPAEGTVAEGMPNFVLGDTAAVHDMDGDGVPETDARDVVDAALQGYALIASGNVEIADGRRSRPRVPRGTPPRPPRGDRPGRPGR